MECLGENSWAPLGWSLGVPARLPPQDARFVCSPKVPLEDPWGFCAVPRVPSGWSMGIPLVWLNTIRVLWVSSGILWKVLGIPGGSLESLGAILGDPRSFGCTGSTLCGRYGGSLAWSFGILAGSLGFLGVVLGVVLGGPRSFGCTRWAFCGLPWGSLGESSGDPPWGSSLGGVGIPLGIP